MDSFEHPTSCGLRASWSPFRCMAKWEATVLCLNRLWAIPDPFSFLLFLLHDNISLNLLSNILFSVFLNVDINIKGIAGLPSPLTSPQPPSFPTRVGSGLLFTWSESPVFPAACVGEGLLSCGLVGLLRLMLCVPAPLESPGAVESLSKWLKLFPSRLYCTLSHGPPMAVCATKA